MYECVSVFVLCCITVLHYYYCIIVLHYVRRLERIWIFAIQISFWLNDGSVVCVTGHVTERSWILIPAEAVGEFSSPWSIFCADSYFGTRSTSVTAVARKWYWSFCQKCRWQVTAKHTCTLRMWLRMKWQCKLVRGCMVCSKHAPTRQHFYVVPSM